MIIADNNRMRVKFFNQEIPDILLSWLICEYLGKWNNGEVIYTGFFEQLNFFIESVDETYAQNGRGNHLSGMRMKGDDDSFTIYFFCLLFQVFNDLSMTLMNAIKCTDRNDRVSKGWQVLNVSMNFHI